MPKIVANDIPALTEAGWNDLFPGGNLGAYVAAQNAYHHRPLTQPITSGEAVTGRYQAIIGPWTHGEHVNEETLQAIRLEWFDTWLKNAPTGMANTSTPLHLFENGADTWVDSAAWPLSSDAKTYYLGDGSLTPGEPKEQGGDSLAWSAATAANTLTYTTAPLTKAALLDGPTDVTLYAKSTTTEAELSAKLSIVAPDGTVTKQADGILLGSQRALDSGRAGTAPTAASSSPVTPSHRHRSARSPRAGRPATTSRCCPTSPRSRPVTESSSASTANPGRLPLPVAPTPQELANLTGGVYTVEHSPQAASFVNLPLTTPSSATPSRDNWGPSS